MAMEVELIFFGPRFPRASLVGAAAGPISWESGKGRFWKASKAAGGFWRDFAELDSTDPDQVIGFIRRRGNPYREESTKDWTSLQSFLQDLACAWRREDGSGISRLKANYSTRAASTSDFFSREAYQILMRVALEPHPDGSLSFAASTKNLAAFMVASAVSAIERGVAMRRCRYCRSWFELARKDQLFCSASCRTRFSVEGGANG